MTNIAKLKDRDKQNLQEKQEQKNNLTEETPIRHRTKKDLQKRGAC